MRFSKLHAPLFLLLLVCAGCKKPTPATGEPAALKKEPITADELASILDTRVWKFVPPRLPNAEGTDYQLMVLLKGQPPRTLLTVGGRSGDDGPITVGLHTVSADKLEFYLGFEGSFGKTSGENFFRDMGTAADGNLTVDSGNRVLLLTGRKGSSVSPGDPESDAMLFLCWKAREKSQ
jgi:hypothetical protein